MTPVSEGLHIRPHQPADRAVIRRINAAAFNRPDPGDLFDRFRAERPDILSLVAEADGAVIGHVLFSPVRLDGSEVPGMGLGELAVLPGRQRQGAGTALVRAGLDRLRAAGCVFSIVVGHATYYPRFGYRPGAQLGFRCQWPSVPDDKFQALILDERYAGRLGGIVRFDGIP